MLVGALTHAAGGCVPVMLCAGPSVSSRGYQARMDSAIGCLLQGLSGHFPVDFAPEMLNTSVTSSARWKISTSSRSPWNLLAVLRSPPMRRGLVDQVGPRVVMLNVCLSVADIAST